MIGLSISDEIGATNEYIAMPAIAMKNKLRRANPIYDYHKNNNFAGELKGAAVSTLLKNQSKLIQELTAYKKWDRFDRNVDEDKGLKKRDCILSSIGALKDAWELVFQLENDLEPIQKSNYQMYKRFANSVFSFVSCFYF